MNRVPRARDILTSTSDDAPLFPQREDVLFRHLQMANGTYKTTGHGRLRDLDQWLLGQMQAPADVRFLDIGVSSGATTVDLIEAAGDRDIRLRTIGIDIGIEAFVQPISGGGDLLLDSQRIPLQLATGGSTWGRPTRGIHSARATVGRLLFGALGNRAVQRVLASGTPTPVRLLCLRARRCSDATFQEHDVFRREDAWLESFELVRAANVLHRAYFTDDQLRSAFDHVWHYLATEGRFLVARTADEDGITRGTLFTKAEDGRFTVLDRFNGGSDVEQLVLTIRATAR